MDTSPKIVVDKDTHQLGIAKYEDTAAYPSRKGWWVEFTVNVDGSIDYGHSRFDGPLGDLKFLDKYYVLRTENDE